MTTDHRKGERGKRWVGGGDVEGGNNHEKGGWGYNKSQATSAAIMAATIDNSHKR